MKHALIFDFGGVLMKTVNYTPRHNWDKTLNLPTGSVERAVHNTESWKAAQIGEISIEQYWQDVQLRLRLSADQLTQLQEDFYAGDQIDETILAYIKEMRLDGISVALLSNDSIELRTKLKRLQILHLFDPLVISAEIGVMKPDAGAYTVVLERLNLPATQTIFIDDMLVNINAATALGIHGIHYHPDLDLRNVISPLLES